MRFLHKCPWECLKTLREKVLDILFKMLLCGSNSVGLTNYLDNIFHKFYKQASKFGVEVFCAFNYLNYINNLKLSIDSAVSTGGFLEGTLSHTGGHIGP